MREVFGDTVSVLKLGLVNPLPEKLIRDFAAKAEELYVIEELDGFIEDHCRKLGIDVCGKKRFTPIGEYSQKSIAAAFGMESESPVSADSPIPVRPPMMCSGCPHRGLFYTLAKNKITVLGDIGCYTLGAQKPLDALDSTLCMARRSPDSTASIRRTAARAPERTSASSATPPSSIPASPDLSISPTTIPPPRS